MDMWRFVVFFSSLLLHICHSTTSNSVVLACSDHTHCGIGRYCRVDGTCAGCFFCHRALDEPSFTTPVSLPINGACPVTCDCTNHTDCPTQYFCRFIRRSTYNECTLCEDCRIENPFDGLPCPERCLCTSSTQCKDGQYCANFPDRGGLCTDCLRHVCTDNLLVANETCDQVCPDFFQCDGHSDCELSSGGTPYGRWCNFGHQCSDACSQRCTLFGRTQTPDLRLAYEAHLRDPNANPIPLQGSQDSIDFSCPESCCDLGGGPSEFALEYDDRLFFGHCDGEENVRYAAYYVPGRHDPNMTVETLVADGLPCDVQQHEFKVGYPKLLTVVDCRAVLREIEGCDPTNVTHGVLVGVRGQADASMAYFDPIAMPYTKLMNENERCLMEEVVVFFIAYTIALSVILAMIAAGGGLILHRKVVAVWCGCHKLSKAVVDVAVSADNSEIHKDDA